MTKQTIALPPEATDSGALARLLLIETRAPSAPGYNRDDSVKAMRLMRRVVENRLAAPARYAARGATTEQDIVRMGNQFAGFRDYPTLPGLLALKLGRLLDSARAGHSDTQAFVSDAVMVATDATSNPTYSQVTAWRTTGRGSPGPGFQFLVSLQGNDFYATIPAPPVSQQHRHGGPFRPHTPSKSGNSKHRHS